MWVFTRPRSGQEYDLLISEVRGGSWFCPIHRFDGLNQISIHSTGTVLKTVTSPRKLHQARMGLKIICGCSSENYENFLEIISGNECLAGSNFVFSHALEGQERPRTVRKIIFRSERNVRVLAYFKDISSLMGMILFTYCSSMEPW